MIKMTSEVAENDKTRLSVKRWLREGQQLLSVDLQKANAIPYSFAIEKLLRGITENSEIIYACAPDAKHLKEKLEQKQRSLHSLVFQTVLARVYPIERQVFYLFLRLEVLAKTVGLVETDKLQGQLIEESQDCHHSLTVFIAEQIKHNQMELPQIQMLSERATFLEKRLREIQYYLQKMITAPTIVASLASDWVQKFTENVSTLKQRQNALQQMLQTIALPELQLLLQKAVSRNENYIWCYEAKELEKTMTLLQKYLSHTPQEAQSYPGLIRFFEDRQAIVFPLTKEDCLSLFKTRELSALPEQLEKSRQTLKKISPVLARLHQQLLQIENTHPSLLMNATEIYENNSSTDYDSHVSQIKTIDEIIKACLDNKAALAGIEDSIDVNLSADRMKEKLMDLGEGSVQEIENIASQHSALVQALRQHISGVKSILKRAETLRTGLERTLLSLNKPPSNKEESDAELNLIFHADPKKDTQKAENKPGKGFFNVKALLKASERWPVR